MARPEVSGKKLTPSARRKRRRQQLQQTISPACYSVQSFCIAHHLSESYYYELRKRGLGPRETKIGDRKTIITFEDAATWRAQDWEAARAAATAAATAAE